MKEKKYLTGLKGLACVMIMVGHFLGVYKYAQEFVPHIKILDIIIDTKLNFLINESFYLYLFFIISGYLVALTGGGVNSIGKLVNKVFTRFLRLGLPIFFSYLVIYIFLYKLIGFHNFETTNIFTCDWFQGYFRGDYSFKDVLMGPVNVLIIGKSSLDSVYWVLQEMFISSVLIYALAYLKHVMNRKPVIFNVVYIAVLLLSGIYSEIIFACLIGAFITFYQGEIKNFQSNKYILTGVLLVSFFLYAMPRGYLATISFSIMVLLIPKINTLNAAVSSKLPMCLGRISWGIYSFHWPILCSLGSLLLIRLNETLSLSAAYIISMLISAVMTVIVSVIFYYTFEKLSAFIVKKYKQASERFFAK